MRRLGWYAVTLFVAVLILCGVLLLAANLYVQSPVVQQRIRRALAASLHMPVSIRKITVTPWEGLRIDGLTASAPGSAGLAKPFSAEVPDFLTAESFRVHFALLPLLHRQVVVTLLWLDKPELAWAQEPDGRWEFPPGSNPAKHRRKPATLQQEASPSPLPSPSVPPAPAVVITTPLPAATAAAVQSVTPPAAIRAPSGFTVALDRFRMRHGNVNLLNAKRHSIGLFEDVSLDGRLTDARQRASGTVWFDKASMPRIGLSLTQFHSNFAYDHDDGLTLSDSEATFAGGVVAARCHVSNREPGSPFSAECRVEEVKLQRLLQEVVGNRLQGVEGSLQGKVVIHGLSGSPDSREATGRFELLNAQLKDFPLLQTLGDALRIADLSHTQLKQAQLDCRLDGTILEIEPLLLVSNDLRITAQGRYLTGDDHLDLHARLVIDQAVSRQLPDFIEGQFKPCGDEAPGSRFVDFDVTGPLNNPKSNLYSRVVGDPMKDFLHGFLGTKPKTPREKPSKRPPDSAATPSPAAPPAGAGSGS